MKRIRALLAGGAAVVLVVAAPAPARAATISGTVVARDGDRGTVLTAVRGGGAYTLRVADARRYAPGARVRAAVSSLGDGTYRATRVTRLGRAAGAKVRAAVVSREGRSYVVSAGSSTFAVRATGRHPAAAATGAVVVVALKLSKGGRVS